MRIPYIKLRVIQQFNINLQIRLSDDETAIIIYIILFYFYRAATKFKRILCGELDVSYGVLHTDLTSLINSVPLRKTRSVGLNVSFFFSYISACVHLRRLV